MRSPVFKGISRGYYFVLGLILIFALIACGGGGGGNPNNDTSANSSGTGSTKGPLEDIEGSEFYSSANTSARLNGPILGNSSANLVQKTKTISFTVMNPSSITVRQVYLMQLPIVDDNGSFSGEMDDRLLVVFQNTSNQIRCGAGLLTPNLFDADDELLTDGASGSWWWGSIYYDEFNENPYCLAPNEMAYLVRHFTFTSDLNNGETERFHNASYAKITFADWINDDHDDRIKADTGITPISFDISDTGLNYEYDVLFTNKSSIESCLELFNVVYLDEQGLPVGFHYYRLVNEFITPGEELIVKMTNDRASHGPSSTIRVIMQLDNTEGADSSCSKG